MIKREKIFIEAIKFACKKANIKIPKIRASKKLKNYLALAYVGHNEISYDRNSIGQENYLYLILTGFHEVGHFVDTKGRRAEREYKAEKFALNLLKKYYPSKYTIAIKNIREILNRYKCQQKKWHKPYIKALTKILREEK